MSSRRHAPATARGIGTLFAAALLAAGCAIAAGAGAAATLTVTNLDDSGPGSLRATVAAAAAGDTIEFAPGLDGVIQFGSPLGLLRPVTIDGGRRVTLDGNDSVRLLEVATVPGVILRGLTLRHGRALDGGAIDSSGDLTLIDCVLRDNVATREGGAINVSFGRIRVIRSVIQSNEALGSGGGGLSIGGGTGPSTIVDSTFAGNLGRRGGAIYFGASQTLTIARSELIGNQATDVGGGIAVALGTLAIADAVITGNSASTGGGIAVSRSSTAAPTLVIERALLSANRAGQDGGAMSLEAGQTSVVNATLVDNLAFNGSGGALAVGGSFSPVTASATVTNATISNNRAGGAGGGVAMLNFGALILRNSIVAINGFDGTGGAGPEISGAFTSEGFNLVLIRAGSSGYIPADLPDGTNPQLGAVQANGGFSAVALVAPGSPALDRVPAARCAGLNVTVDQRGFGRPVGSNCDVGAAESGAVALADALFRNAFEAP